MGKKYKFNSFEAVSCAEPLNSKAGPVKMRHHTQAGGHSDLHPLAHSPLYCQVTFTESLETYTRCNGKTFYYSDGFTYTDDGNHHGEVNMLLPTPAAHLTPPRFQVKNESALCFTKHKCKQCYHNFMKLGLGLLHYSTHAMNFNEIKSKMLERFSALSQFEGVTSLDGCSKFKKNTHYCKFNALLRRDGDGSMVERYVLMFYVHRKKVNNVRLNAVK